MDMSICNIYIYMYPLVMTNIAKGNGPFIDGLHLKNGVFSMAMLNNQMVCIYIYMCPSGKKQQPFTNEWLIDYECSGHGLWI